VTESQQPGGGGGGGRPSPFRPLIFIAAVFVGVALIFVVARMAGSEDRIPWQSDLARARHEAQTSRKQVFVYFTADWCGPCQQMKRTTFSDMEVDRVLRFHIPVKIDIDQQPVLARKYRVESIPHFAVLDDEGDPAASASGYMTSEELIGFVKRASKRDLE